MWDVSQIARTDPQRGVLLTQSPSADALRALVLEALKTALLRGRARMAAERSSGSARDPRAVIQFWVGSQLFDWFFNSENGYRAQYRSGPGAGLTYNDRIIIEARGLLLDLLPPVITVRVFTSGFHDAGAENVATREWTRSLHSSLSKIWMCGSLIQTDGSQPTSLPVGLDNTRINVGSTHDWASITRIDADAWLEIKGAFVGEQGCYQPKDPAERARRLHSHGEA